MMLHVTETDPYKRAVIVKEWLAALNAEALPAFLKANPTKEKKDFLPFDVQKIAPIMDGALYFTDREEYLGWAKDKIYFKGFAYTHKPGSPDDGVPFIPGMEPNMPAAPATPPAGGENAPA